MIAIVTIGLIAFVVLASVALAIVQFRKVTSLVFHCSKCNQHFHQPPHRDFPRKCPRCHAVDWAV